jgi:hypothetical protein
MSIIKGFCLIVIYVNLLSNEEQARYLVYFRINKVLPLIGRKKSKNKYIPDTYSHTWFRS